MKRRLLLLVAAISILAVLIIPAFRMPSNCGGNSAALAQVREIWLLVTLNPARADGDSIRFQDATGTAADQFAKEARSHWTGKARYWVTAGSFAESDTRRIVVVSDTPYTNVPQRRWGASPPTHAVAYADGATGLITPDEFSKLDKTQFVPLDELDPSP